MPDVAFSAAVEGDTDEVVVRTLARHVGFVVCNVYGRRGKQHLRSKVQGYNHAARIAPWLVLVDLDTEADCAASLAEEWLPNPAAYMYFRVAVRSVESWLLADIEGLSKFLRVSRKRLPALPDSVALPKQMIVNLARDSRSTAIQQDMVPRDGSGRNVGPAYTSRLAEFVTSHWSPSRAAPRSDSLQRAIRRLSVV